jgi:hypothetical protein
MTEYNYDRSDVYPPDFRDEYRVRYYDHSYDENMYYEYYQAMKQRTRDASEHSRQMRMLELSNARALANMRRRSGTSDQTFAQSLWLTIVLPYYE